MNSKDLKQLKGELEHSKLTNTKARLDAETNALRMAASYVGHGPRKLTEAFGQMVDPIEYVRDGAGVSHFGDLVSNALARPEDHRNGDNAPIWQSEAEHRQIVGKARILSAASEVGLSAMENLTNYVIGGGFGYQFIPKKGFEKDGDAKRWAGIAQQISDAFDEANRFAEDGERELFARSRRDGEFFAGLVHRGGESVELRQVDTSFVTQPDNIAGLEEFLDLGPGMCWKYGVVTEPNNPARSFGYFVEWAGDGNDWDFFPSELMVHHKLNVDREVKRGLSDFYPVEGNLTRGDKLLNNTLEGASIQAAIAFIREHSLGVTTDTIQDLVRGGADEDIDTVTPRGTTKTRNIKNYRPGTVHDVTNGMKYHAGPMGGPNGPRYIEVVQAALRMVGIRWTMPEYMISGDASNSNFASTLVSESPFTKASEAKQSSYVRKFRELKWKAVGLVAAKTGKFGTNDLRHIMKKVELTVDPPEIAVRDKMEEHQIRRDEFNAGILSLDTWANEAGRELEDEVAKGAKAQPKPEPPQPGQQPGQPQPPGKQAAEKPAAKGEPTPMAEYWTSYP